MTNKQALDRLDQMLNELNINKPCTDCANRFTTVHIAAEKDEDPADDGWPPVHSEQTA